MSEPTYGRCVHGNSMASCDLCVRESQAYKDAVEVLKSATHPTDAELLARVQSGMDELLADNQVLRDRIRRLEAENARLTETVRDYRKADDARFADKLNKITGKQAFKPIADNPPDDDTPIDEVREQNVNLAILVRRLVRVVTRHDNGNKVANQALGYLARNSLMGSVVRDESEAAG